MELLAETDWVVVTKDLGFPVAICLMLLLAIGSFFVCVAWTLYRIGVWGAPIVERVANKHVNLMDTLEGNSHVITATLQTMSDTQIAVESREGRTMKAIEDLSVTQKKIADDLTSILVQVQGDATIQDKSVAMGKGP